MATKYENQRQRKNPPHVAVGALRAVSGLTLDQVCERASEVLGRPLTRGALSAIEHGYRGPSTEVLRALEVAFGLREGDLVTDYQPRTWEPMSA